MKILKTIERICKNIHWAIFNHPPTDIKRDHKERKCDYCGSTKGWYHCADTKMTICWGCIKKIADEILLPLNDLETKTDITECVVLYDEE